MSLSDLTTEEQSLYKSILSGNIQSLERDLITNQDPVDQSKNLLNQLKIIIKELGRVWNIEHDLQGKLLSPSESISSSDIETFYSNAAPLFELIRSRLLVLSSVKRIAVGTLVNVHNFSQVIELSLREQGYLTYYWGSNLKTSEIQEKIIQTPITILVLSCMAVNSENNCLEELKQLRQTFPDLKILVGGPVFTNFLLLKEDKEHPTLTIPYKENLLYYEEIKKASDLKEFVSKVFNVEYCETIDELLEAVGK